MPTKSVVIWQVVACFLNGTRFGSGVAHDILWSVGAPADAVSAAFQPWGQALIWTP